MTPVPQARSHCGTGSAEQRDTLFAPAEAARRACVIGSAALTMAAAYLDEHGDADAAGALEELQRLVTDARQELAAFEDGILGISCAVVPEAVLSCIATGIVALSQVQAQTSIYQAIPGIVLAETDMLVYLARAGARPANR
jgi:hypothetical protein